MIEAPLPLPHALIVPAGVDAYCRADTVVEPVLGAAESFPDRLVGDFELLGGDAAVVVEEAQAVVAPDEGGALYATAGVDFGPAFAGFGAFAGSRREPVGAGWGGGEGSVG